MQETAVRDLAEGVALQELPDGGMLRGQVDGEEVLLIRRGETAYAVGASCSHYHGPLGEGLLAGDTLRCPWHHACFDIRTGAVLHAPALDPIPCWRVERVGDRFFVRAKRTGPGAASATREATRDVPRRAGRDGLRSVVIVGGGAAGLAAAMTLRARGLRGHAAAPQRRRAPPYDRPNLSKDFLAGTAPEEWIPLRAPEFYAEQQHRRCCTRRARRSLDADASD